MSMFRFSYRRLSLSVIITGILLVSFVAAPLLTLVQPALSAPEDWWNTEWLFRKEITIDHTKVGAALENFSVLIDVTDSDLANKAQPDGDDIVFTDSDGVQLGHEIELYDSATGHLVAWVNVPSLSSIADTVLYMYYGNPVAENQENVTAVWDPRYVMVQHLNEKSNPHHCRLWGMIADSLPEDVVLDHLINLPYSLKNLGAINDDGWGLAYYNDTEATVLRGEPPANVDPNFDLAAQELAGSGACIGVGHVRAAASGATEIPNPHPFMRYKNDKWWAFGHNGVLSKTILKNLIGPEYLAENPPTVGDDWDDPDVIDSDLYMLYILKCIEENDWNVLMGIAKAVVDISEADSGAMNFFLTDGEVLWGFRKDRTLYYYHSLSPQYSALASQYPTSSQDDWVWLEDYNLVELTRERAPRIIEDIRELPWISAPSPSNGTTDVPVFISELGFNVTDYQGDLMNYTVVTSPDIGSDSAINVGNGRYVVPVSDLDFSTTYIWRVNVTDGTYWANETFTFTTEVIQLLVDSEFDDSVDSDDLRFDGAGQDWYESREQDPSLLALDMSDVGGDATKKAKFTESSTTNAYLSQEFSSAQTGVFTVQWDIYVDEILDIGDPDRAGWMLIGDDTYAGRPGPNSYDTERFVYMAFFKDGGGTEGTMDLVARDRNDGWTSFTTIATGLNLKQWYTVEVVCDLTADTYDVYVDGVFMATVTSRHSKDSVTHISFAQWDDGAGTFYVDNVFAPAQDRYKLTINVVGSGLVDVDPAEATYAEGTEVTLAAVPDAGWAFSEWSGDLTGAENPTTIFMDGDKTVIASFTEEVNVPPVVSDPEPADMAIDVPISTSLLNFTISDADSDLMDYYVSTSPDIGSDSALGASDGTYGLAVSGLEHGTPYTWWVNVTDGTDWTNVTFTFTTESAPHKHYDSTSNGNDGTVYDGVVMGATGKIDGADIFDGTSGYVEVPHDNTITGFTEGFTVSVWVKLDTIAIRQTIINKYDTAGSQRGWLLDYRSQERVFAFFASAEGATYQWWYADFTPQAGVWYHVAVVWEANTVPKFYVNGQQVPTVRSGTVPRIYNNAGAPLHIGRSTYAGRYLDGILDEIRMSDTARTAAWLATCYNNQENPTGFYTIGSEESYVGAPWISDESPRNGTSDVPVSISELSFNVTDYQGDLMNYTVVTSPDIGSDSAIRVGDGRYAVLIGGLDYSTTYTWRVDVTDGTYWTNVTYTFTTEAFVNHPPTHDDPLLVSSGGTDTTIEDLTCYNTTTYDPDGDKVANMYHWYKNDESLSNLLMPFDTNSSTTTKDYSGYDNHGTIYGATWISEGVVGGAYALDGDDYISIPDDSSLDGDGAWSEMTTEHWIYIMADQSGVRTIAKRGSTAGRSYQIGFQTSGPSNHVYAAVFADSYIEARYDDVALSLNTWYHVAFTYRSHVGVTLYLNGTAVATASGSGNIRPSSGQPLYIGKYLANYFTGIVDDVRIYPISLSKQQIYEHYLESKDGLSSSSTIVSQQTNGGDVWQCEVTPTDGKQEGTMKLSNAITVIDAEIITLKWSKLFDLQGTHSGVLVADIVGNDLEEVIYAGLGMVVVLNGTDGSVIWTYSDPALDDHFVQPQMADLNLDGIFEIVVNLPWVAGLVALHGNNGTVYWRVTGLGGGGITASPVICDIDGDGYPTIFAAGNDIEEPYEGRITALSYDGQVLYQTFSWRACSGGLSIGDTDNDGEFELYMGDRNRNYGDAGLGRGVRSFWAKNLTVRWEQPDILCSSNRPILADVNKDGVLDVIVVHHRGGIAVLNSNDGSPIRKSLNLGMPGHYQPSVYDIDGDGNLEILMADGEHTSTTNDIVIWDLVEWREDARTYVGRCFFGPQIADVTGDGVMDVIVCSYDGVHILDSTLSLIDEVNGLLGGILNYPVIQDIDGDGLNEIVVTSYYGAIYAFDTPAPRPTPRARSEVQFYSEYRRGVAEYVPPPGRPAPVISGPAPSHLVTNVPLSLSVLSFDLMDFQGDLMDYTVTTSPDIGSDAGINVGNGRYTVLISGLEYSTAYTWQVTVTDGTHWDAKTFQFTTEAETAWWNTRWPYRKEVILDHSKVASDLYEFPVLIDVVDDDVAGKAQLNGDDIVFTSSEGVKLSHEIELYDGSIGHLIAWVRVPTLFSTADTKIYMYYGNPTAENQEDPEGVWNPDYMTVYHMNEESSVHSDSTSHGNDGTVYGATRGVSGKIDGTYSFDGVNDYVEAPHSGTLTGFTEGLTVSIWVKLEDLTRRQSILHKYDTAGNQRGWFIEYRVPERAFTFFASPDGATYQWWYADFTPQAGVWYHVAVVWEANTVPKFYVNGQQVPTVRSGTVPRIYNNVDTPLHIGRSTYAGRYLDGILDEIRMSDTARTAAWITTCYNNQENPTNFYTIGSEETLPQQPFISDPYPANGAVNVPVSLSELGFNLTDFQYDLMNYTVTTSPDIGSGSGTNVPNGRYTVSISGLEYSTAYTWQINVTDGTHWKNLTYTFTTEALVEWLVDSEFNDSVSSEDLRDNGAGQDWYESREQDPGLLTLDTSNVGGDTTKKAKFTESSTTNAYLSQEFSSPQSGVFAVQWDIYVDSIADISAPDRAGWMLIGDDTYAGRPGPNSYDTERFVYMAFFKDGGGTEGTMDLVAREAGAGWTAFTTIAFGLNLKQWYTIKVVCDLIADTYDVYVDGIYKATVTSRNAKTSVTHISFAQWNDGAGTFYVDNVFSPAQDRHKLSVTIVGNGSVEKDPGEATYAYGTEVILTAVPADGWTFSGWSGDLSGAETPVNITMDGDKTVTATFTEVPNNPPVVSDPQPANETDGVLVSTSLLNFTISDADGDSMDYYVSTSPNVGSDSQIGVSDGAYNLTVSGLAYGTEYTWWVNVTDGVEWTNSSFTFTTEELLLVDSEFDDSVDSDDLRADGPDQDWYESRNDDPSLLTLDETDVGGDATKKANFTGSSSGNAYLSQEFRSAQTGTFSVQWDIYIDEILDISAPDRTGWMLIGDDSGGTNGPNSANAERFVYMVFYKPGGGTSGTMDLVARDRDDGWTSFTTIATGLNLKQWYTIKVVCDLIADTYDVYVDGVYMDTVTSRIAKTSVTHISFAQWNDGAGTFYVDNVFSPAQQTNGGGGYPAANNNDTSASYMANTQYLPPVFLLVAVLVAFSLRKNKRKRK